MSLLLLLPCLLCVLVGGAWLNGMEGVMTQVFSCGVGEVDGLEVSKRRACIGLCTTTHTWPRALCCWWCGWGGGQARAPGVFVVVAHVCMHEPHRRIADSFLLQRERASHPHQLTHPNPPTHPGTSASTSSSSTGTSRSRRRRRSRSKRKKQRGWSEEARSWPSQAEEGKHQQEEGKGRRTGVGLSSTSSKPSR